MGAGKLIVCMMAAGMTLLAVGVAFHFAVPIVAPGIPPQFDDAGLFRPWGGWTSAYMLLHPLGYGVAFASAYTLLLRRGAGGWRSGLKYGLGVFLVGALPVWLLAYASFRVSSEVMASFIVQAACQYLAAGAVIGAVAGRDRA